MVGVGDLRVEQQRVKRPIRCFHCGNRRRVARRRDRKSRRHRRHVVAMARPDAQVGRDRREQLRSWSAVSVHVDHCMTELAVPRPPHLASQHVGHQLHAVADPEHRRAEFEDARRALGRAFLRHALRAARQDDAGRIFLAQRLDRRVEWQDFGVHGELAQTTSDELRVLRAEIQDEDGLMGHAEPETEREPSSGEQRSVNDAYYIVVFVSRTTRYWVSLALTTCAVIVAWGVCPQAQQPSGTSAETSSKVSAAQRREAIARAWRDAKPTPVRLVGTEAAWTVTLPAPPSAPGALDDRRVYIPLRSNLLVALDRETGVLAWSRAIETASPLLAADNSLYVVAGERIHALNVLDGADRWS